MRRLGLPLGAAFAPRKPGKRRTHARLSEAPLRAELLTAAQMAERGHELAGEHEWRRGRSRDVQLLERLRHNEILIDDTCRELAAAIVDKHRITPAGEWLLDHLYVIHEQGRKTRAHLPRGYSAELPLLTRGASAGMPRVYDLALDAISHGDGRVDQDSIARFVRAYQERAPLSLGELWAIPIMLRAALIENLGRAAARVRRGLAQSRLAARWAQQMLDTAQRDPKNLILVVADMARSEPPLTQAFVAEMARSLHGSGAALNLPLTWIEQRLAESGLSITQLVQTSHHERALDRVTIDNSIASLRLLDALDWHEFVETTSAVDRVLGQDPAGVYTRMDFATRDAYRHAVERYARLGARSEIEIAQAALECAREAAAAADQQTAAHVGYHLVGAGRAQLMRRCGAGAVARALETWRSGGLPFLVYFGAVVTLGLAMAAPVLRPLWAADLPVWLRLLATFCGAVAISHPAIWLVDRLALAAVSPRPLPRMDFRGGIPVEARTLVVVPCLLGSTGEARTLADQLELRHLANREAGLGFALLSDFADADEAELAGDAAILDAAADAIQALNRRHPKAHFLLLHRPRVWNDSEQCWMGRERKRGKLGDLNALLRRGDAAAFSCIVGDRAALNGVRYVITLDVDTRLPSDAARRLIETMAHPLNRPDLAADGRRVDSGYAILQPRIGNLLPSAGSTRYAALFGGDAGLDPYTLAVSDLYQDLFGQGSFIGKGIYEVEAFERTLDAGVAGGAAGRFPDNRILSHDLLEGCYARAGLTADIELYEEYPQSYRVDAQRRARWIRGDWQIAAWLFPSVPMAQGRRERNPLSWLSRWKIFDNLRRSVLPPASFALLLLAWFALPHPLAWTLFVLAAMLLPVAVDAAIALPHPPGNGLARHVGSVLRGAAAAVARVAFRLICLPFEALQNASMILRTGWRVHVSKRRLLQWIASSIVTQRTRAEGGMAAWSEMKAAPIAALAVAAALVLFRADVLGIAAPWLVAWFFAPAIVAWTARVPPRETQPLNAAQTRFLRQAARRTWAWFERFVSAEDNWLPPDHFQEYPSVKIMHRTSSTNIGMGMLANLAAYDLGYVSLRSLIAATRRTFDTLQKLERYRGHIYNWYDTETLKPLQPMYVSTVDSGNFVGHLLTLRQGLFECLRAPIVGAQAFAGLGDTFAVLRALRANAADDLWRPFADALAAARQLPPDLPITPTRNALHELFLRAQALHAALANDEPVVREWSEKLLRQTAMCLADVEDFVGDVSIPAAVARDAEAIHTESPMPSLAALAAAKSISPAARDLAQACMRELEALGALCADFASVDFAFLFDPAREQFAIGYNVSEGRRDAGYYDLLASEARLAVYLAVAQGQIPQDGWFALGRVQTRVDEGQVLLSWSGSMFEYLMPQLVMPAWPDSLIAESARVAVARQIAWGREHGLPWGISESGYFLTDAGQNYHYRAFGAPGLGLQRGLSQDRVIAPYASALALLAAPAAAADNLAEIAARGWWSQWGYYEAIDFTPAHLPAGEAVGVVREYMAHHQGMSLVAFDECLNAAPMQRRFAADAELAATLLLLQERMPRDVALAPVAVAALDARIEEEAVTAPQRRYTQANAPARPAVQLLSNGSYRLMLTHNGGGYSRWRDLDLTRWREDPTRDCWGTWIGIRDLDSGKVWSTLAAAAADAVEARETVFDDARIEQRLAVDELEVRVQIVVSPEDDVELRRLRLTNRARNARALELTSYAEVVLNTGAADALHPAFNNLFVRTEILHAHSAILATRRPRLAGDAQPWLMHQFCVREEADRAAASVETSFETDRARFLGRGNGAHDPAAMRRAGALSNTAGEVLDPIAAIRLRVILPAEGSLVVDLVTGAGESRDAVHALSDKYRDRAFADRALAISTTHNRMLLGQINVGESEAQLYSRLASAILYADPARRAQAEAAASNRLSQNGLWAHGISGDLPIALVLIEDVEKLALVRQAAAAQRYCRTKGLSFDLVVLNEERGGYRQEVNDAIYGAVAAIGEGAMIDRPGGVFIRASAQIPHEDRVQLLAVARVVLSGGAGSFSEQLKDAKAAAETAVRKFVATRRAEGTDARQTSIPKLEMFNGYGGFARGGREYVIVSEANKRTPLPWANVLANPHFGSVVTESGCGYTFFDNAHEYRLTPWSGDAVTDAGGEAFYLRDEESGAYWSPAPAPACGRGRYLTRHGFGYSQFEHVEDGIASELRVHVDGEAPVKFFVLRLRNDSGRARRLTVTGYVEWVLGDLPAKTAQHVTSWLDAGGAVVARNTWNAEFADRVAFFDVEHAQRTVTGDRSEFIGRNGHPGSPAAMQRASLSGRVGACLDPCAAIQVPLELADGESREVIFRLGAARNAEEAESLIARFRRSGSARASFEAVVAKWQRLTGNVVVTTPDAGFNLLANGWLAYQTIACRLWARSGLHQSGGAFGFRDQLQDAMALVHAEPALLREQILLAAQRQFREGDVQHWWHPPGGRGVRTRCSDDYLWLPLAVARYVRTSGDYDVLAERSHYLEGRPLNAGEESYYDLPLRSNEASDLYQHCVRAIEHALGAGSKGTAHGLPRIGSGDWNDGFSAVGIEGRGESVWLGFFLHHVLMEFGEVAALRGDDIFAARCARHARELRAQIEQHAWDGGWYRRAWFDDGTPLGSKNNAQCRIDSVAQSWAVLSGAASADRAATALGALDAQLVDEAAKLVRLLHPPFERSTAEGGRSRPPEEPAAPDPGYIAGYPPGVRENGGQYTHAAVWAVMAFARAGRVERAWELFDLINPLRHAADEESAEVYKGEPYVVAGDVYADGAHRGRAGWTWYTGSAGWMYRLLLETFMGLTREGPRLRIAPRLPAAWPGADVAYRHFDATYAIHIQRDASKPPGTVVLDGVVQSDDSIVLDASSGVHRVEVYLGTDTA